MPRTDRTPLPALNCDPRLLTTPEAAALLKISKSKVAELLKDGRIKSVKIDRMRRIRLSALQEYVDSL